MTTASMARALASLGFLGLLLASCAQIAGVTTREAGGTSGTSGSGLSTGGVAGSLSSAGIGGSMAAMGGAGVAGSSGAATGGSGGQGHGGRGGSAGSSGAAGSAGSSGAAGSSGQSGSAGSGGSSSCNPMQLPNNAVFVSTNGPSSGNGTQGTPYPTISRALMEHSMSADTTIVIDEGQYQESLVLASNGRLTLAGGYVYDSTTSSWSYDCSVTASKTQITSPTNLGIDIQTTAPVHLIEFTISTAHGASIPGQPGQSTYGVFVRSPSAQVTFSGVAILPSSAGNGATAPAPAPSMSTISCNGTSDCSDGAPGMNPLAGADASAGTWDPMNGYIPGNGQPGLQGGNGDNGKMATQIACLRSCINTLSACIPAVASSSGTCGCGGLGGPGGNPGMGGGTSIGVVAQGTLLFENSFILAGNGGNGSPGSMGGQGSPGSAGASGPACFTSCNNGTCTPVGPTSGASGGMGGNGAPGSMGGGGSGGSSYAIFNFMQNATITIAGSTLFTPRAAGMGAGSAPSGTSTIMGM